MGSRGTGTFSDYSGTKRGKGRDSGREDRCNKAFSLEIEDVARSEYYSSTGRLPDVGSTLYINAASRLEVREESGLLIGYVPTRFNYLVNCIDGGFSYHGVVTDADTVPFPSISADFRPV